MCGSAFFIGIGIFLTYVFRSVVSLLLFLVPYVDDLFTVFLFHQIWSHTPLVVVIVVFVCFCFSSQGINIYLLEIEELAWKSNEG